MTFHTITCPNCGHEIPNRAMLGQGTQRGAEMQLSTNRKAILAVLRDATKPLTVREVQQALVQRNVRRVSTRGAGWNYHTVQADLSILVGGRHIEMARPHEIEFFDELAGFTTHTQPVYFIPKGVR